METFTHILCAAAFALAGCSSNGDTPIEPNTDLGMVADASDMGPDEGVDWGDQDVITGPAAVRLIAFSDLHGRLEAESMHGGMAHVARMIGELRAEEPRTLVLTSGDMFGGSAPLSGLLHDEPTVAVMNAIGVDAATVGNHEFDRPLDELQRLLTGGCHVDGCVIGDTWEGATFPTLAANVVTKATGEPAFPPFLLLEAGEVTVGVIGLTYQETASAVYAPFVEPLFFEDEVEVVNGLVPLVEEMGADLIVVLLHQGGHATGLPPSGCDAPTGAVFDIVDQFDEAVDVVIGGHTHAAYVCERGGKLITQAGTRGELLTVIDLVVDVGTSEVLSADADNRWVTQDGTEDAEVRMLIDDYAVVLEPVISETVGTITGNISRVTDLTHQSAAGLLIADALFAGATSDGAVAAFTNSSGIRGDLRFAKSGDETVDGEVTFGETYTMIPFANSVVTMTLSGEQIDQMLEDQLLEGHSNWAQPSSGFHYTWDRDAPDGSKVDPSEILIQGIPIELDATYRIAVNSFMASGPSGFETLTQGTDVTWGPVDTELVRSYFENNSPIDPPALDRIVVK